MFTLGFKTERQKMILGKDKNEIDELKRLKKLRTLVISEIQMYKNNDESEDMTISDLEEWLNEIENNITRLINKD
mgnify:CR=1 FL=1